jgi:hypothetical protein
MQRNTTIDRLVTKDKRNDMDKHSLQGMGEKVLINFYGK